MFKAFLLFAFVLCTFTANSAAQTSDKDAAKVPLENYIKGHATGVAEYMKKAFHSEGQLIFIRDGKYAATVKKMRKLLDEAR